MKTHYIIIAICFSIRLFSQNVGINETGSQPHSSAALDVDAAPANNRGFLMPRIPLVATNLASPVVSPATSLLVYNTSTTAGTFSVTPGFYYWDGTKWVTVGAGNSGSNAWQLLGNATTTAGANFLGTTGAQDMVIKTNNVENIRISNLNGNVGINTNSPVVKLQINSTDGIGVPYGTTVQQPVGAPIGTTRFNTTLGCMEAFNGTCWQNINTPPIGATYLQWAGSADPNSIYPCTIWVSSDLQNGQFIRAEGGNANVSAGAALTNVVQADAVQNHAHSASGSANGSGVLTSSPAGAHDHNLSGAGGGVMQWDVGSYPGYQIGSEYSNISGTPSGLRNYFFVAEPNHTHTIPDHTHTVNITVGNMSTGTASAETRPANVAVRFWRRTN